MKKGSILAIVPAITAMLLTGCEGGNVSKSTDGVVNGTNGTGTATVPTGTSNSTGQTQNTTAHTEGAGGATESATNGTHGNEATGSTSGATEHTGATGESQGESRTESTPPPPPPAPRGRVRAGLQPHPLRRETALACSRAAGPGAGYPSCKRWGPDCRTEGLLPGGSRTGPAARRALRPVGGW